MNHAAIVSFRGDYEFLSNFHVGELIMFQNMGYATAEHLFQALKATEVTDYLKVAFAKEPAQSKRLGNSIKLRQDWELVKIHAMLVTLRAKFRQGSGLAALLEATGERHLEEGNSHGDRTWGTVNGVGRNLLGRLLMRVRAENRGQSCRDTEINNFGGVIDFAFTR